MDTINISYFRVRKLAFFFLLLPVLLFLLFFVKPLISIPITAIMLWVLYLALQEKTYEKKAIPVSRRTLILFAVICAIWCYMGGQGGLFFQTSDWNERNAIFRDLIVNRWPVYYPATNTALTYYIGHWLPAAALSRGLYLLTNNVDLAFSVGNILLWAWTLFGVMITLLLHFCSARPENKRGQWIIFLLFIGFSGMDILGTWIQKWNMNDLLRILHIEWWYVDYQFSSNTTCLFWVFNQAITAWVGTLCFFNEKNNRNYAFIIACSLLSASLPSVGLAILMIGSVVVQVYKAVKKNALWKYVKRTFSFVNVASTACLVPVIGAYLLSNSAIEKTVESDPSRVVPTFGPRMRIVVPLIAVFAVVLLALFVYLRKTKRTELAKFVGGAAFLVFVMDAVLFAFPGANKMYFVFLLLECGIYWLLLATDNYNHPLFYLSALVLVISPLVKVGIGADFCMRASLPALALMMVFCARKLCMWADNLKAGKRSGWAFVSGCLLALCLLIGAATPAMEFYRGIHKTIEGGTLVQPADEIYTLNQYHSSGGIYGNFVSESYEESIFFQYFAR